MHSGAAGWALLLQAEEHFLQPKMHMGKRRSEVDVASLRPLSLNRATTDVAPARGTLFLKGGYETEKHLWKQQKGE